jgi:lipoprotein-releasing system permease protein
MSVYSLQGPLYDYDYIKTKVKTISGVEDVNPIVQSQALISVGGISNGVMVRGMTWEDFSNRPLLRNSVVMGKLENFTGNTVAIGSVLADKMKLVPGDKIVITSPQVKSTPFGSMPRQRSYNVSIVFDVEMYEYNNGFVFMPLETAQAFFQTDGGISALEIFIKNPNQLQEIRDAVSLQIEGKAGVYDWRDMNQSFFNALQVERNVMFLILTLIVIVAAFNIISSMIMLVKDKTHDIAIMRTMGASRANMMKIFTLTGASIGVMGTVVGAVFGITFALNIQSIREFLQGLTGTELFSAEIYFLSKLPAVIDWSEVLMVVAMAFVLSILATLYPAWRAARLDPVEALRYE